MSLWGSHLKNLTKQRGTAIIVALFITALVAAASFAMMERLRTDTHRTELLLNDIQMNLYAQGSIYWAIDQLANDLKQQQPGKVTDRTPIRSPVNEMNGAKISSVIYDAQGKLNINNLTDSQFQTLFTRLLQIVQPNLDLPAAQAITLNVVNWITPGMANSQLDQYYEHLNPSYRMPHRLMASVSELRLVKGITPELYTKLAPLVTALPEKTMLNINSVPVPLLMSFSSSISLEMAKALDAERQRNPFPSLDAMNNFSIVKSNPIAQNNLTVSSNYFIVRTTVTLGTQRMTLYTLLMRLLKDSQPTAIILWQSKGTL